MIDTATVKQQTDLLALIGHDVQLKRVASTNGGEYAGPCPFCGGVDRFRVWPRADKPGWWCRGCELSGDAIAYVMKRDNLDFSAAFDRLGGTMPQPMKPAQPCPSAPEGPPEAAWQAAARRIIEDCEAALWGAGGARALAWLKARGLWEETLLGWRVGYCSANGDYHGLYMDRGIVIPWLAGDEVWKLNIRRPVGDPKYRAVKGSHSAGALFGVDRLMGKPDCVITEGEFDLMVIWQECGDLADAMTMGSNTGHVSDRWLPALLRYRRFWIATDNDEAGDRAAQYWLTLTGERGRRLTPPKGKDITDSLLAGVALHDWLEAALSGGFE